MKKYYDEYEKYSLLYPDNQDFNHAVDLVTHYKQSEEYKRVQEKLKPLLDDLIEREKSEGSTATPKTVAYATNFFWQVLNSMYVHEICCKAPLHMHLVMHMQIIAKQDQCISQAFCTPRSAKDQF